MEEKDSSSQRVVNKSAYFPSLPAITSIPTAAIEEFIHLCIDSLLGRQPSFDKFGSPLSIGPLSLAYTQWVAAAVGQNIERPKLGEELRAAAISDDIITLLITAVVTRWDEVDKRLKEHASHLYPLHLQDFDWSLRLVLGSDRLSATRSPSLLLSLRVGESDDLFATSSSPSTSLAAPSTVRAAANTLAPVLPSLAHQSSNNTAATVHLELNKEQLDALLEQFEAVAQAIKLV